MPKLEDVLGRGERILLVDDDQIFIDLQRQVLGLLNYRAIPETNSIEALNLFRNNPSLFDVVITDFQMPIFSGLSLIQRMSQLSPTTIFVLVSGYNYCAELAALKLQASCFLMKPVSLMTFGQALHELLEDRWYQQNPALAGINY